MSAFRVLSLMALLALLMACAMTAANVTVQQPEQPTTDVVAGEPTPSVELADPEQPGQVSVDFSYPEGWTAEFDQDQNQMILHHPSNGATISFTIWPIEQGTPAQRIYAIWEEMEDDADQGAPIEAGQPANYTSDGVEANYMISTLTVEGGQRITLMHVAYVSNLPQLGVLITGVWPVNLQAEMMPALRQVAGSIHISIGNPAAEPAILTLEPNRIMTLRMCTDF